MIELIKRDIRLAWDQGTALWVAATVFVMICSLLAIGLGGSAVVLSAAAPGIVWAALSVSALIALSSGFATDMESGALDQLRLRGHTLWEIALARIVASFCTILLPLSLAGMIVAEIFAVEGGEKLKLAASLVVGGPALTSYGVLSGAILATSGRGGLLGILFSLPFIVPVVIFGEAAVGETGALMSSSPLQALLGISLVAVVISAVASAAALGVNGE